VLSRNLEWFIIVDAQIVLRACGSIVVPVALITPNSKRKILNPQREETLWKLGGAQRREWREMNRTCNAGIWRKKRGGHCKELIASAYQNEIPFFKKFPRVDPYCRIGNRELGREAEFLKMRKKIIAANWKMNMTVAETVSYLENFRSHVDEVNGVEIVIAPPFTAIAKLSEILGGSQKIRLGAQNMYFEMSGAFTGEISPAMLRELFVRYVILGHSERRQIFGETDALINKKVLVALPSGLRPILCVGETLEERDAGREKDVLETQLRGSLAEVTPAQMNDVVIAYEPVWAIGTGRNATPEQAQDAHAHVRAVLSELTDAATAAKVRIQYGGSVKPANAATLLSQPDIDGALVGGASLEPLAFSEIVKAAVEK